MKDEEFLQYMSACVDEQTLVSAKQVNRLKQLAKYAETDFPPAGWWGHLHPGTARAAIKDAFENLKAKPDAV